MCMCWRTDEQVQGLFLPQEPGVDLVSVPHRGWEGVGVGVCPIVARKFLVNVPCGNFASLTSSQYKSCLFPAFCIMLGVPYGSLLL